MPMKTVPPLLPFMWVKMLRYFATVVIIVFFLNCSCTDGMLIMRARPPPMQDFISVFQKFKLAINLLVSSFCGTVQSTAV